MSAESAPLDRPPLLSSELLAYYRWVSTQPLTVVDVETTGGLAHNCRVIEVSVLRGSLQGGIQDQQTHLLNPQVTVPWKITEFTGISQDMVDGAPLSPEVWPLYLPWLNQGVFTAHNLGFDYSFIQAEYRRLGVKFERSPIHQLCTVILSRLLLADLPSRSLPALVQHFGFQVGTSHRAEADTLACWLLAQQLLTQIQLEPDEKLLTRFSRHCIDLKAAAALLRCSAKQARKVLEQAGVTVRLVGRGQKALYQRGDVEQVYWARKSCQLNWLEP